MKHLTLLAGALLATGCAQQPPAYQPPAAPPATVGECNAGPAQFAVGRDQNAPLVEEVRQRSGSREARVLRPNQVVTMEFNSQRVNVIVDAANKVAAVRCG